MKETIKYTRDQLIEIFKNIKGDIPIHENLKKFQNQPENPVLGSKKSLECIEKTHVPIRKESSFSGRSPFLGAQLAP